MSKTKIRCEPLYLNHKVFRDQTTITFIDGPERETLTLSQLIHFYLQHRNKSNMEIGQKVKIVSCDLHPKYIGKEGVIVNKVGTLYRVKCGSKIIPNFATEDCLQPINEK